MNGGYKAHAVRLFAAVLSVIVGWLVVVSAYTSAARVFLWSLPFAIAALVASVWLMLQPRSKPAQMMVAVSIGLIGIARSAAFVSLDAWTPAPVWALTIWLTVALMWTLREGRMADHMADRKRSER